MWSRSVTGKPYKPRHRPKPLRHRPALPSFTHSHPRLRQHRFGFLQRRARRLTSRGRARPHRARWGFEDLWTALATKNARVCVYILCTVSVSEISKLSIVLDSDEWSTSVPPFHIIYTIGTRKTERGGHQGRREARKSKAALRRICLVVVPWGQTNKLIMNITTGGSGPPRVAPKRPNRACPFSLGKK